LAAAPRLSRLAAAFSVWLPQTVILLDFFMDVKLFISRIRATQIEVVWESTEENIVM
jgi:hypothetical protein